MNQDCAEEVPYPPAKLCASPSIIDTLKRQQKQQQEQLEATNKAIKSLEDNPAVFEVLETLAKAGRGLR